MGVVFLAGAVRFDRMVLVCLVPCIVVGDRCIFFGREPVVLGCLVSGCSFRLRVM